ncbi:MAG: pyruvate kinase [Hydrogenophilaceae bacterium]|nr:pyruvate kinase [Hydrogenophilaceae bacterium]
MRTKVIRKSRLKPHHSITAEQLIHALSALKEGAIALEICHQEHIAQARENYQQSARNLLHYISLRQNDIRAIQDDLSLLGLSRLGQAESHVMGSLNAVLTTLHALAGHPVLRPQARQQMRAGKALLIDHTQELLGDPSPDRIPHLMVTLPSEAATDPQLAETLLNEGMGVARINCAHDDAETWQAMIRNIRQAQGKTGRMCKIYADLSGPKLRTGPIEPIGRMAEFKARRDAMGHVVDAARIWLTPSDQPEPPQAGAEITLPLERAFIGLIHGDDVLDVEDLRGVWRHLRIVERYGQSWLAHCHQHAYVKEGASCTLYRGEKRVAQSRIQHLPEVILPLMLKAGDTLMLTGSDTIGHAAECDEAGNLVSPASIPCTLDAVFQAAQPGQPIWFDDGKIGGRIVSNTGSALDIEITHASPRGSKLRPEKGINLPETDLPIPALTEKDRADLRVLANQIDIVGLSFVRNPQDLLDLHAELEELKAGHLGTVLKIETRQGFEQLPMILLSAMRLPPVGIMVARGDLAVEVGFERLAEVQEEILWLAEAAHVPVIWATQVLDTLVKRGLPSRAEVSDAAKGIRAECVMLNKGPYVVEALRFLRDVLLRMREHQSKHRPLLRRLSVCDLPTNNPQRCEM